MRIDVHHHVTLNITSDASGWLEQLAKVLSNTEKIMAKQSEVAATLNTLADQIEKVRKEVQALKDAVASDPDVSPELSAAVDRVVVAVNGVDAINPDAPADGGETPPAGG